MSASKPRPRVAVVVSLLLSAAALVFIGFLFGQRSPKGVFAKRIQEFRRSETLGGVAGEDRAAIALGFDDPALAEKEMDHYAWAIPNMPTPFVGVAPRPGDYPGAKINDDQMRHPAPIARPKPDGVVRIFLVGGSTAFGTAAPSDETTIRGYLQRRLDQELTPHTHKTYEVINAANPAWASTHERILIENKLSEMQPDWVVSLSGINDVHFAWYGHDVLWFRTYAELHFARLSSDLSKYFLGAPLPLGGVWDVEPRTEEPASEVLRRLEKNLRLAAYALNQVGARYLFALQPALETTGKPLSARESAHLAKEVRGEGCNQYFETCYELYSAELPRLELFGFRFVDLSGAFDDMSSADEVFLDSCHFGDRGYRLLAERLFEVLEAELR